MQPGELSPFLSQKFKFWSFVSMFLLVFVHAYNLQISYLQPWTTPGEALTGNSFIQYFLANGILRFRIPMLFIISGYLYALHDSRPYKQRTNKRLRTLLLPYLIWSAFGLLLTYVLEMFPYTRSMISQSHFMQFNNHITLLHQYKWYDWLVRWILIPVPYQLWFIRVLLIYNIAYPWLRNWVSNKKGRWIFFPVAIFLWLTNFGIPFFEGEGLLFFSLGIWMQKTGYNIQSPNKWLKPLPWMLLFVIIAAIKTWLAFKGEAYLGKAIIPVLLFLHKLVVFSGLVAAWFGCDALVKKFMQYQWFVWLSGFSFIIYALHTPLLFYANATLFPLVEHIANYRIAVFMLLPVLIIIFCIATGALLRRVLPKFYSILTGGRGL
jgi:fucose 4-O-acetylase-like acetyltransferase